MNLPTLSVIMPNYNHGHCLPVAVEAILQQSAQPLELIIIDDGSTDRSVEIIEALVRQHPIIKFHRNERNLGVCLTVNRGMDLACGEYLFCTAADDVIQPGFFEKSLRLLAQHPEAGLSCTIGDWREMATGLKWHMGVGMAEKPSYLSPSRIVELERKDKMFIPTHTIIVKRSAALRAGKYIPDLKDAVDWFAACVIAFRHGICVVPEPLCVLQILPDSYFKRSRRDKRGHRAVLEHILWLLHRPDYRDVLGLVRASGSLYVFALPMLKLLLSRAEYRGFVTPTFLRKNLWHTFRMTLKKFIPASVGNFYLRVAGYRASPPPPNP